MLFNFGKYKCLRPGHENFVVKYKMRDTIIGAAVKEND